MIKIKSNNGSKESIEYKKDTLANCISRKLNKLISQIKAEKLINPNLTAESDKLIDEILLFSPGIHRGQVGRISYTYFIDDLNFWIIKNINKQKTIKFYTLLGQKEAVENFKIIQMLYGGKYEKNY